MASTRMFSDMFSENSNSNSSSMMEMDMGDEMPGQTKTHGGFMRSRMSSSNLESGYNSDETEDPMLGDDILSRMFQLIMKEAVYKGEEKLCEFRHPDDLKQEIDLELTEQGMSDQELIGMCSQTIKYSVKTANPMYFNQLCQGVDHYGLAGSWLTDALNTSQYTYEVAPVFTLIEQRILLKMRSLVGYVDGAGDGIFCPGGSVSNMYSLNLARFHRFPEVKTKGVKAMPDVAIFASEQSHYSIMKAVAFLGLGTDNLYEIPCDNRGKMIPEELEKKVIECKAKGIVPLMVHATGGTTVAGAYDPFVPIGDICQRHNIWFHVDTCWGGGALLSKTHKHLLEGIQRSDSVAWNPHKLMGAPQQCCAFLTKHDQLLQEAHSACASYLFQPDKKYDVSYDTGDKSIQCGRKVDVFKLWLMWKARGDVGMEACIDNLFSNAQYLAAKLRNREGFRLVFAEPECTNVCFWFFPPSLRGQEETPEWWQKVAKVAPAIKHRMMQKGSMMITYNPLGDHVNFFRMVLCNSSVQSCHMDYCIEEIARLGADL